MENVGVTTELYKEQDTIRFEWFDDEDYDKTVYILRSRSGLQTCLEEVMNRTAARAYWNHLIERGYESNEGHAV